MANNKINIRKLNELGIKECKKSLALPKKQRRLPNKSLLEDDTYTETIQSFNIQIDKNKGFKDRHELAKYLHGLISKIINNNQALKEDWGMWAWLCLLYIEQLTDNGNAINRYDHYIPVPRGERANLLYRHCVYGPYMAYEYFGDDMKILLSKNIFNMGDCWEQMMSNNLLKDFPQFFEVFKHRYKDTSTGFALEGSNDKVDKPKNGAAWDPIKLKKAGGKIRRFKTVIRQFQVTQRMENVSDTEIKNTLPLPEFN